MSYLGLGKTLFNSSACIFRPSQGRPEIELALSERLLRKKATGLWPEAAIRAVTSGSEPSGIAENRDVHSPIWQENALNRKFPFFEYLEREGLSRFSSHFNPEIQFVTHHRCHAMAAVAMSPFERSIIVVMDGAGSLRKDFGGSARAELFGEGLNPESHEECTVYLQDRGKLTPVFKRWREFHPSTRHPSHTFSGGSGIFYEKSAEYIFNSGRAAGKVMGLASFGRPSAVPDRLAYLEALDWSRSYQGKSKKEWEESGRFQEFADLAASVQLDFELGLFPLLRGLAEKHPSYRNLILTGGCALNCTANGKLLQMGLFDEIYVPPFPGDESIAFGAASYLYHQNSDWMPFTHAEQHGYFGLRASAPTEEGVGRAFAGLMIEKPPSIVEHAATLLSQGQILAWFQGRSESGPRALGNRSILADPRVRGLKDQLNREVKFRESFRPYGASCAHERAREFFEVPPGFNSPYMSFAVRPKAEHRQTLAETCHVDGTSRIQTVRSGQNARFHELLVSVGSKTGLPCLLNTSLNVMGEPIVESLEDARGFLEKTPVHGLVVGDHYIRRQPQE